MTTSPPAQPPTTSPTPDYTTTTANETTNAHPRPTKFRFKDPSRKRHRHHHSSSHKDPQRTPSPKRKKHRAPHRRKHTTSPPPSPSQTTSRFSPSTAFRESLFDALGDDEGAAYWESVYGQPIHTYSVPEVPKGPNGELEMMDEEEYAAYVRRKMWERTREGMLAEEERMREEGRRVKEKERRRERERGEWERAVEESLRRGRERKRRRGWRGVWGRYCACWGELDGVVRGGEDGGGGKRFEEVVFWPVESGERRDVGRKEVEEFMRECARVVDEEDIDKDGDRDGGGGLLGLLKTERVRWHPDKIQHRYGKLGIDERVLKSVTEVFQIVDQMWSEERKKAN
ncbi:uncharacterized protein AKAW2_21259A [Aspergillus luchuensis]|uniref:Similar to An02g04240 n=1 Tax=Aspergillus kawachii TaxID=1069201 RepID=A0A146FNA0_ASPKA|nr:uncharacterized protein AKAW2_21259A [Aspergillus luchuensis]BCR96319.1 hypothetical protein AKAW2_21259A [Aspergillus luchuensis]GAA82270.1 similar to An02g04240 [Aspergillus luchuensis IFO 4308]GAT26613.1 similar to An02g04240 [Aspergillus luchuensis]